MEKQRPPPLKVRLMIKEAFLKNAANDLRPRGTLRAEGKGSEK